MPAIQINGGSFEYIEKGSGTPVVFVHGSLSDYRTWNAQMEPFARHYRVIAYSRRYHYPNPWVGDGSDYSVSLHAKDLLAFVRALGLERPHLVSSSYGAYIALVAALQDPSVPRTLVLGEPPLLPLLMKDSQSSFRLLPLFSKSPALAFALLRFANHSIKPARKAFQRGDSDLAVRLFINGVLGNGSFDKLPSMAREIMRANAKPLEAELFGPGFGAFPIEAARRLSVPTLLVQGEQSPRFFRSITDRLARCLPVNEQVTIQRASHRMHGDNPREYNEKVLTFLRAHSSS